MIRKRNEYTKREPSKDAGKIYIICEGNINGTEKDYYEFFEGLSSNLKLIIIPSEDGKTDPLKLMEQAKKQLLEETRLYNLDYMQNDKVWFAIDTDKWEEQDKIQPLRDFCTEQNDVVKELDERKPYNAWNVAQSNPCFEIWLYYHFYGTPPTEDDVKKHPSMKSYLDSNLIGGYNFQKDPVRIKDAIENSEKNFMRQENGNPALFSTEQHMLGKDILGFVRMEIAKLRNKIG